MRSLQQVVGFPAKRIEPALLRARRSGGCRRFQQRARGFQVLTQLVHFSAGLGIFGAHLVHQTSKLTDLILQVTHRACALPRRRGG